MRVLLHHEVRQILDTRGAAVAVILTGLAILALVAGIVFVLRGESATVPVEDALGIVVLIAPLTISLIVVLAASGEWTHGTAGITVPMVRSRSALYLAKLLAVLIVSIGLYLVAATAVSAGAVIVSLARGGEVQWSGAGRQAYTGLVATLLASFFGYGIVSLIRGFFLSLLAVVGVTLGWNVFAATVLKDEDGYLQSLTPLSLATPGIDEPLPPTLAVLSSLVLWYVVPLAIGWWRYRRSNL